ncbi:sulfatase family protein [Crateriforma conspicua]|uniref:Arylsulfatase n=1 Tax=Crateriforma conspicua TaxID=2527996 RepID=A0A5C5XT62_9PLAN|nr:sulfatase [Crateriforma conspicua]TWT65799.1 Arylsulfatase [Crateriforma conspicua]
MKPTPIIQRFVAACLFLSGAGQAAIADDRPNIVWISCEDISPNLGCYGDPHAITPNLDRLAAEGVRFDRAFTTAGVCAVVRSSIITGMYPPSIGSQHMRSRIILPPGVRPFPELMRAAGYFTTNREKTDYQFEPTPAIWDRQGKKHQDWRERPDPDQPFFSVINFTVSHESQVRHGEKRHAEVIDEIGEANRHDPIECADTMPDYMPNTPAARKNWAWYHDNITLMDKMAGEVLDRLEQDGLADNTLVFFWSDHGMGLPRGKRWIYDTGTLVPVIARWPDHLDAGGRRPDLVTLMDLVPTTLQAAGVEVPDYMHGRTLFTADQSDDVSKEPPYIFLHRDRMDEVYELQRGARDRRWKYIRNYHPDRPYSQRLDYMDEMPMMQDWRRMNAAGRLSGGQANWFQLPKPIEELYDTEKDPWELNNLAELPQYADRLARMRQATERWQTRIGDTGMIPEAVLMEEMKPGGKMPRTLPPEIEFTDGKVHLRSPTESGSLVYRIRTEDQWSGWRLYVGPIEAPAVPLQAMACRAGLRDSKLSDWRPTDR